MKSVKIIPSKSDAHRAIICASLSNKPCQVICDLKSKDIYASERCMASLKEGKHIMECGESGSTLRFLLPIMGALGKEAFFLPEGRLPERPLSPLYEELEAHGCKLSPLRSVPFHIEGKLRSGEYRIPGNVSSQYITGLLLALPLLEGDSKIIVDGMLESKGYVDLTLGVLKKFNINIKVESFGYLVPGGQSYIGPEKYFVEGDWSNAAFWLVAGLFLKEGMKVTGLSMESLQGDKEIVQVIKRFGGNVKAEEGFAVTRESNLIGTNIDGSQIPDMIPSIALMAAVASGTTVISGASRLRIKESDRLKTISETLNALGGNVREKEDGLIIEGVPYLKGGIVNGANDHRIVMTAAIASLVSREKVIITGSQAVEKSYPNFFKEMKRMGIDKNLERR